MMTEKEKYRLVWNLEGYGKDWTNPGLAGSIKRWIRQHFNPGEAVTDFGCGNATSLQWLESVGYVSNGVDIADNANNHPAVTIGDLRDPLTLPMATYGLCTDVMEHIPTKDVGQVLKLISYNVTSGVLFVIARDKDKDGDRIGQTLHLTRQKSDWWDEHLTKYFSRIDVLMNEDDSAYCLIAWL